LLRIGRIEAPRDRWKAPLAIRPDFPLFYWVTNGFVQREFYVYRVVRPNDAFDRPSGQRRDWLNVLSSEMASEIRISIYAEEFIAIVSSDYSADTIETSTWWTIKNGKLYRDWSTLSEKRKKYYFIRGKQNCLKRMTSRFILLIKICSISMCGVWVCNTQQSNVKNTTWYNFYEILTYE